MTRVIKCLMGGLLLLGLTSCGHQVSEDRPSVERPGLGAPLPSSSGGSMAEKAPVSNFFNSHKVGLLLPLSGEYADLGKALLEAAELALFEGENPSLILLLQDTAQAGARAAAERALREGAELLLGPVFAADVKEIKPILGANKVNLICFSTDQSVAGEGVYVLGFLPGQQIERIVRFARLSGLKKIGALTPEDAYGQAVARTLEGLASKGEVELLGITHYRREDVLEGNPGNERIVEAVRDYQTRGLQALVVPEGGDNLYNLARFLKPEGAPVFLGSGQWDTPEVLTVPELAGDIFVSTDPQDLRQFEGRFKAAYGYLPPRIVSLAYDATALAVGLVERGYGAQHLTRSQGFAGVDGLFRFTPQGLNERGLAVVEVGSGGLKSLSEAPRAF